MLNAEQRNQLVNLRTKVRELKDLSTELTLVRNMIVSALSFIENDPHYDASGLCKKFMSMYFDKLMNLQFNTNTLTDFDISMLYLAFFSKEFVSRTKVTIDTTTNILMYYDAGRLKDHQIPYKVLVDCYDVHEYDMITNNIAQLGIDAETRFKEVIEIIENATQIKTEEAGKLATRVETLKKYIENLHTEYNFAGLLHAFESMLKDKKGELDVLKWLLWLFGILLLIPPVAGLCFLLYNPQFLAGNTSGVAGDNSYLFYSSRVIPLVLAESLLVYYFRIILHQFYSSKGQIAQLQLRNAICMFIEHHADFKKDKAESAFEKFDTLIFSPIAVQYDKIPNTLDGIEQLGKLMDKIKGK